MTDKNGDYEDSDSSEEVENPDQRSDKPKKTWKGRAQKLLKRKKNKPSGDQNSKKDAAKGKGSRTRSSDSSTSDASNLHEMPPVEEESYLYQTQPVPGHPYRHGSNTATILTQPRPSSATPGSALSTARPGYHLLPPITPMQVHGNIVQGQSPVQPSVTNPLTVPEKSRDQPKSNYELRLMQENTNLSKKVKELESTSYVLKGEKDSFAKQLATEKEERRKEKEDAAKALAEVEKQSAQEKAISAQASKKLARALEAKTQENADLMQQLPMKDEHSRQLEDQLAQREKEMHALHKKVQEVNVHCQKQVEKAKQDLELSHFEVKSLKNQVAKYQRQQEQDEWRVQELEDDMKGKEEHVHQLKETIANLHKQLDDAKVEIQKKAEEVKSNQEVAAETKRAEGEKAALLVQEVQKYKDLMRRFAKENSQVTHLQERLEQKEEEFKTTIENMKKEMSTLSARPEVPISSVHVSLGEGATASSGPSSLEEEHKKVSILEDSVKTSDEQLQWIRQEKANLERELGEERVAKNRLEAEKARLAAELQAVPDDTVWTAQIAELEKELQHVQGEKENLHREVCALKHERDRAVLPSQNAHILREKETAIHKLQVALMKEKESLSDLEKTLQEKEDKIYKLEEDLRESQKKNGKEKKEDGQPGFHENHAQRVQARNLELEESLKKERETVEEKEAAVNELTAELQQLRANYKEAQLDQDSAVAQLLQLRTSYEDLQRRHESEKAAYNREVELHERTTQNLDKARKKATELHTIGQSQETELIRAREQLASAELQLSQLVAEKESLTRQMERTLAAKDDEIADMKQKTNEIRIQMQKRFTQIAEELASATGCVNSKEVMIEQLRAEVEKLKDKLETCRAQAMSFKSDFEEERRDRERMNDELEESKDSVAKLEATVNQQHTQNQQLRNQIEGLLHQVNEVSAKKKDLRNQVDTLNTELQTTHAQIKGYKTQSDGLRKEREDWRKRAQSTEELLQQSLQEGQENQEKVTQLERELVSEKNNHEHFKGAFKKATAMRDELSARNAHLEEQLTKALLDQENAAAQLQQLRASYEVLEHQNAQLAGYQARQEAKKSRARQALLAQSENQPLPSPLVPGSGHPPPAHVGYEMGRGLNSGGQQVIPGHGGPAAGHHHRSSANAPQQQLQQGLSPSYSHHHQQLQHLQPPYQQGVALAGQGYSSHSSPPSLDNTNRAIPHPTQVCDRTPLSDHQQVVHSNVNSSIRRAPHSQPPSQYGPTNAHPSTHHKLQASSNAQSNVPPASQQTNPRAQDHHHHASRPFENPPDNQATLVDNPLMDNIDQDIAEVAGEVREMSKPPSTMQHSLHQDQHLPHQQQLQGEPGFEIPIDPNLVCSKCGTKFRHGEIQKLRKHYGQCRGKL